MHFVIAALCIVGLYVSILMYRKTLLARRRQLVEPSVVQSPRAALAGGVSNAAVGIAYYAALFVASFFLAQPLVLHAALAASALAAAVSLYLAYSLLFITRMPCSYCWTGHAVNWLLLLLLYARIW